MNAPLRSALCGSATALLPARRNRRHRWLWNAHGPARATRSWRVSLERFGAVRPRRGRFRPTAASVPAAGLLDLPIATDRYLRATCSRSQLGAGATRVSSSPALAAGNRRQQARPTTTVPAECALAERSSPICSVTAEAGQAAFASRHGHLKKRRRTRLATR